MSWWATPRCSPSTPPCAATTPEAAIRTGVATAQVRFQLVFDLLGGRWLQGEPRPYRENDRSAARQILQGVLKAGDLLIRDLGYASIGVFEEIAAMKAWFLSRMIPGAVLFEAASGTRLDPLALAREKAPRPGDVCSVPVLLGVGKRLPCRLVIRNDGERVGSERRRRLAKEAKRRGTAPAKPYLKLQNWTLLVSNLDEGAASSEQLLALYETRWRIENVFKLAKSETKLSKLVGHRSNPHHIDLLLWGWILAMVEFGKMASSPRSSRACARTGAANAFRSNEASSKRWSGSSKSRPRLLSSPPQEALRSSCGERWPKLNTTTATRKGRGNPFPR